MGAGNSTIKIWASFIITFVCLIESRNLFLPAEIFFLKKFLLLRPLKSRMHPFQPSK